jgi:hypothetical protein
MGEYADGLIRRPRVSGPAAGGAYRRGGARFPLCLLAGALFLQAALALPTSGGTGWPAPLTKFVERSTACMHFAGEFNGDRSARDTEVNRRMDELHCNALPHELRTLRQRYHGDARISARLKAFDDDGMPTDADADP